MSFGWRQVEKQRWVTIDVQRGAKNSFGFAVDFDAPNVTFQPLKQNLKVSFAGNDTNFDLR